MVRKTSQKNSSPSKDKVVTRSSNKLKTKTASNENVISNKSKQAKSTVKAKPSPKKAFNKVLRSRRTIKYAESSLDQSKSKSITTPRVEKKPIYKQNLNNQRKAPKRKADLYEFDDDSDNNNKKRAKKKLDSSSSFEYSKTVKKIVKNVANKPKKTKKKDIFLDKITKVNKNKEKILSKVPEKIIVRENRVLSNVPEVNKENKVPENKTKENLTKPMLSTSETENVLTSPPKIKILSDICLNQGKELDISMTSPRLFKNTQPNANSTMVNNVLTPWRFNDINIRRNPHFISYKESALPSINQEMVLDHTIVDKVESNRTPNRTDALTSTPEIKRRTSPRKSKIQSKINDYFNSTQNNEHIEPSIFDIDCESSTDDKENVPNNEQNIFDFDKISPIKNNQHTGRPFRVNFNLSDRKYEPKRKRIIQVEEEEKEPETVIASDEESNDESDVSDTESENNRDIKLFEDFTDTSNLLEISRTIRPKKTKNKKTHKKKDVRTKQEEEEAEKWAAEFNSMCEEIDKFPLEIE